LATLSTPPCEFRLARDATPQNLFLQSTAPGNKKLPKFSVLLRVNENTTLSTKVTSGPIWELSVDHLVYLKESQKVVKVREAMKLDYSEFPAVFAYEKFAPGHPPKALVRADTKVWRLDLGHASLKETRNDIEAAIELARTTPGLGAYWILKKDENKQYVKPGGIAIVSTSQVIIPGLSAHSFAAE